MLDFEKQSNRAVRIRYFKTTCRSYSVF